MRKIFWTLLLVSMPVYSLTLVEQADLDALRAELMEYIYDLQEQVKELGEQNDGSTGSGGGSGGGDNGGSGNPDPDPPVDCTLDAPCPEGGPGKEFRMDWPYDNEASVESARYKNRPLFPMIVYDEQVQAARLTFDGKVSVSGGDQLYCRAPREFGPSEGDTRVEYGFQVFFGPEWEAAPPGVANYKAVRLDNNKKIAGFKVQPWSEQMFETNWRVGEVVSPVVAVVGARKYAFPYAELESEFQQYRILEDGKKVWDYQPGGVTTAVNFERPYTSDMHLRELEPDHPMRAFGATKGPFLIFVERWYSLRYVWEQKDDGLWYMDAYIQEEGEPEVHYMTRLFHKEFPNGNWAMSAKLIRCPEMNTSQHADGAFEPKRVWWRNFYLEVE